MTMLRAHFMQQLFTLSDPAMEKAFFAAQLHHEFAQLEEFARMHDESTNLRFRTPKKPPDCTRRSATDRGHLNSHRR